MAKIDISGCCSQGCWIPLWV